MFKVWKSLKNFRKANKLWLFSFKLWHVAKISTQIVILNLIIMVYHKTDWFTTNFQGMFNVCFSVYRWNLFLCWFVPYCGSKKQGSSLSEIILWQYQNKSTFKDLPRVIEPQKSIWTKILAPNSFIKISSQKQTTSSKYLRSILTADTHNLEYYCFFGQADLQPL